MEPHEASSPIRTDAPADVTPDNALLALIARLHAYFERAQRGGVAGIDAESAHRRAASLVLAEAALRLSKSSTQRKRPPQVAVIGPTQVGKSTVVNLLLGVDAADVSPLAGYTQHAQGFSTLAGGSVGEWSAAVFPGWQRAPQAALRKGPLETYSLEEVELPFRLSADGAAGTSELPPCIVWDTPDFDSLSAGQYERGVLEVAALADVFLLVLSKEKYSDLSVWSFLRLLEPLQRPLIIALNKITPEAAEPIERSLRERLATLGAGWGAVTIVPIAYQPDMGSSPEAGLPPVPGLIAAVRGATSKLARSSAGALQLVAKSWDDWVSPVRAEQAAVEAWNERVEHGLGRFVERYQKDYLDHPHRYVAFRRASVELLRLLEIPHVSGWISKAREVTTWPIRQLWRAGQQWRDAGRKDGRVRAHLSAEEAVLDEAVDELLTSLARDAARRSGAAEVGAGVWRALEQRLRTEEARLRTVFHEALAEHHREVSREVHETASQLFEKLRKQPARLATLRGARVTLDLGSVLLAVKTGGLTPADAIWAPATLAFSSLLMEGFAGVQMSDTARGLKKRQLQRVHGTLIDGRLRPRLQAVVDALADDALTGISARELKAAEHARQTWEQAADE